MHARKKSLPKSPAWPPPPPPPPAAWINIRTLALEGKPFADVQNFFDRFPARAQALLPKPVWDLSKHSTGMAVRFVTNASTLTARWRVTSPELAKDHMPATGVSGLDLYTKIRGHWRWLGIGRPTQFPENQFVILNTLAPPLSREMLLYLPLYNQLEDAWIGIPKGTTLKAAPPRPRAHHKPLCFYGTSIVHGGCAARPGMTYPAIIARHLDRPFFNFGFSGNGRSEPEIAHLLAELDVAAYILDALPNMTREQVEERIEPFVKILHARRPAVPIILVENIHYEDSYAVIERRINVTQKNAALRRIFLRLRRAGLKSLRLVAGNNLLGHDGEATIDGVHPTNAGFLRMAQEIEPVIRAALHSKAGGRK